MFGDLIEVEPLSSLGTSDSELEQDRQEFLVLHFCNVEPECWTRLNPLLGMFVNIAEARS